MTSKRKRLGSFEKEMLVELSGGDLLVGFLLSARSTRRMFKIARERAAWRQQRERALRRLAEAGYIDCAHGSDGDIARLTDHGRHALDDTITRLHDALRRKDWDGQWHLVLFDIPERYRASRAALRDVLHRAGFKRVQHSAYVHPFPCNELVDLLERDPHLKMRVLYATISSLRHAENLKKNFGLH